MTRFRCKPIDMERPAAWHACADQLLAEGWFYDSDSKQWVNGEPHPVLGSAEPGYDDHEVGRIAWSPDGLRAWLIHPGPRPTVEQLLARTVIGTPDSHHVEVSA